MSVPSHNLYKFIHQVTENRYWVQYFYPWGSKDLSNLVNLQVSHDTIKDELVGIPENKLVHNQLGIHLNSMNFYQHVQNFQQILLCHDQEPLNYELYCDNSPLMEVVNKTNLTNLNFPVTGLNLRASNPTSWQKSCILLHSELNSQELAKYERTGRYIGAFWWSHALIARDWYRMAEHDLSFNQQLTKKHKFLIYCRDSSGSRTYRKTFLDKLSLSVKSCCQFESYDNDQVTSDSSAIYEAKDFVLTDISVVLETVFDSRIHLTEKIVRSIACGHPFILAAGPGSLEFLKKYGFKTFNPWIDESYDTELNSDRRLSMIVSEIERINQLSTEEYTTLVKHCQEIAEHNKNVFFSLNFMEQLITELKYNISLADAIAGNQLSPEFYLKLKQWRKLNDPDQLITAERIADRPTWLRLLKYVRSSRSLKQN